MTRITFDLLPGDCAINRRYEGNGRGGFRLSPQYRTAVEWMAWTVRAAHPKKIEHGEVVLRIDVYWPHPVSKSCSRAKGDVDACVKAVLDALEKGCAYDDDGRVVEFTARKHVDRVRPRIEVEIRQVTE